MHQSDGSVLINLTVAITPTGLEPAGASDNALRAAVRFTYEVDGLQLEGELSLRVSVAG